ncbi:MAG: hypothetical protein QOG43_3393 [Actinomycetota bacterium]|jgi:uncharacterized protein (TIGR02246 family)|nr:hypothetical protein [Actinomycetota bacterium]
MPSAAAVEALFRSLLAAWNDCDAAAFGRLFAADGTLVGFDGSPVDSRASITEHLAGIFADHRPGAYVAKVREVRELGSGPALLRAVVGMVPPGGSAIDPRLNAVQSLVVVEGEGGLRIAHFHTTPAAFHGRPDAVDALTDELQAVLAAEG